MTTLTEDLVRLTDISDTIDEIEAYMGNAKYEDFFKRDDLRQLAGAELAQIGGAATLLTDEFKELHGEVDWDMLRGLQYAGYDEELEMDFHALWHIVHEDLPIIQDQILELLTSLEDDEEGSDLTLNREDKKDIQARYTEREVGKEIIDQEENIKYEDENPEQKPVHLPNAVSSVEDTEDETKFKFPPIE
jgi:uncharacterized protein with HEPN domain